VQSLEKLKPLALLLLRVAFGVIFIFHGYPKLTHTHQTVEMFGKMGFPGYFAYIAGVLETFGGAVLIVGVFTRIAALLLAIEMAVAALKVHGLIAHPSDVNAYQFPLALCVACFVLATVGPGILSIDQALFERASPVSRRARA
jgi:putative oxidoreductase